MGKLRTFWKGLIAGGAAGAGVAALAAVNASVAREAPEPETGAVGGEAGTYQWKHGQIFYRHAGEERAPAGSVSSMVNGIPIRKNSPATNSVARSPTPASISGAHSAPR